MLKKSSAPIRYARRDRSRNERNITAGLIKMELYLQKKLPLVWRICDLLSKGVTVRPNQGKVILTSIMGLLNCRNQLVNGFQTAIVVWLYANHIPKVGIEVLHELGHCSSYQHLIKVLKALAASLKVQTADWASRMARLMTLDNVNQMVGVRDTISTRAGALMVNSTCSFVTLVFGMPKGYRFIPRDWALRGLRVNLQPSDLDPSPSAVEFMGRYCEYYLAALQDTYIGTRLPRGANEFVKPEIEVLHLQAPGILAFDVMPIEQSTTVGNLQGIQRVLTQEFKYSKSDMADGLFLVGGNQLLAEQVRGIQKARESDVSGEDFSGIIPILEPLHTVMNYKKMQLKHHMGEKNGSRLRSLYYMNQKLRRQYVDEKGSHFWACKDFTRDALEEVCIGLMVSDRGARNWDDFRSKVVSGVIDWRLIMTGLSKKLEYNYVDCQREQEDDERDRVYENLLLFVRSEIELTAFYKSIRNGDVGAMELELQL